MATERGQVLRQGFIAGVIGYAAVVLFFILVNLVEGRSPFHTVALLGSSLFYGLEDARRLVIEPGPILAYNGIHLLVSLVAGTVSAWVVYEVERHHFLWYFALIALIAGFLYSLVVVGLLGAELSEALPWWLVAFANLVWVGSMGLYLWRAHPGLLREIAEEQESPG